jgi:hypothetical protein
MLIGGLMQTVRSLGSASLLEFVYLATPIFPSTELVGAAVVIPVHSSLYLFQDINHSAFHSGG